MRRLRDDAAWNPLLKINRNEPCPCDSGKKFKRCHLLTLPRAIPKHLAAEYTKVLKTAPGIHFTEEELPIENTQESKL